MREPRILATLRKDSEIREARYGFALAAWLFGIWSVIRLPYLSIFFIDEISLVDKILSFLLTMFVFGVTVIAIKRYKDLGKLREKLIKDPKKYREVKVSGPPILTTIIPFLLK